MMNPDSSNIVSILFLCTLFLTCSKETSTNYGNTKNYRPEVSEKGALLSTNYDSFDSLNKVVKTAYSTSSTLYGNHDIVELSYSEDDKYATSILRSGISENDLKSAASGGIKKRLELLFQIPSFIRERADFEKVYALSRRNFLKFGEKDLAFYQVAEEMVGNIDDYDLAKLSSKDLTEKGFINTFNHVNAQTFMTALFSEDLADFIADAHERKNMPELVTGKFSEEQKKDLQFGPVDNYIDMLNNEWGQELGKRLKVKYGLSRTTYWTPELLANFLNDIQNHYSWTFHIGFKPFTDHDELILYFSKKLNIVLENDH